ncbi:diguanylate cyclase [Bifidobacterium canis]|uniref:Diguanylate cyclase n=1 Tax=Bifidobacterium canis TaxID=2610880 RepID=A0A7K1J7I1_9BIFI|nr:diguanylate cyclase [Bifidobacterium canis]MUH60499.1 diguanylate cyclase [Bifidobacterium canis]
MTELTCTGIHLGSGAEGTEEIDVDLRWSTRQGVGSRIQAVAEYARSIGQTLRGEPLDELAEAIATRLCGQFDIDGMTVTVRERLLGEGRMFDEASASTTFERNSAVSNPDRQPQRGSGTPRGEGAPFEAVGVDPVFHDVVVSLQSPMPNADRLFQEVIVTIDGIPGNQVNGVSPLYFVSSLDGSDSKAAVMKISTAMPINQLGQVLTALQNTHEGALTLQIVAVSDSGDESFTSVGDDPQSLGAAVLGPWNDMDPDARLDGDPLAYLFAMTSDSTQVGVESDRWLMGGLA